MSREVYLYSTIAEYQYYNKKLRELEPCTSLDDFTRRQYEAKEQGLNKSLKNVKNSLEELVNRYHPELAGESIDIIIAELMAQMPQDNVRLARVVNARGNGMTP